MGTKPLTHITSSGTNQLFQVTYDVKQPAIYSQTYRKLGHCLYQSFHSAFVNNGSKAAGI